MEVTLQAVLDKLNIDSYFENTNTDVELYSDPSFNSMDSGNDKKLIEKSIEYLLNNSTTAKSYFQMLVDNQNLTIEVVREERDFYVDVTNRLTPKINLDFDYIAHFGYITPGGQVATYHPEIAIMHDKCYCGLRL